MNETIYVPEIDEGAGLTGQPFMSSSMWLPLKEIPNPNILINASVFSYEDPKTGKVRDVRLAEICGDYLVIARHLFPDWTTLVDSWDTFQQDYENVPFDDLISIRPKQVQAWAALDKASNGILNLGCGKGKTVLALKKIASAKGPAVVVCPAGLIDQWVERAEEFLGLAPDQIGIVRQKSREWDKPLVLCSVDTLAGIADDLPMSLRYRFKTVIFDEVHHLSARTFLKTADLFFGNRYGLTATPKRRDGLEPVYYAHLGEVFHSDIIGDITAEVIMYPLDTDINMRREEVLDKRGELSVGKLRSFMGSIPGRNHVIISNIAKALSKGRKVLVLSHSKDHGPRLFESAMSHPIIKKYKVGLVEQKHKPKKRIAIIQDSDVSFATMGVAAEGLDVSELDTLYLVTPFASWTEFQQAKGRVERKCDGKKNPLVIIFDDFKVGPAHYMLRGLCREMRLNGVKFRRL